MNSFLIITSDKELRESHARELAEEQHISVFDIAIIATEKSIGIEDIRIMQKQIMLKPMQGANKAIIINDAHTLTTEAQNALLKTLEEPPLHTYLYLTAENVHNLLPTILSRTSLITLQEQKQIDEQLLQEIQSQIQQLLGSAIGDKLHFAETLAADKGAALIWIEQAIYVMRQQMLDDTVGARNIVPLLESFQEAHRTIKTTNTNTRLTLENLFLNSLTTDN